MRTVRTITRSGPGAVLRAALRGSAALGAVAVSAHTASAGGFGQPVPWEMTRQVPVTENARDILNFEIGLHWLSLAISVFVLGLILWCIFRFNEKRNPVASRTTHNTAIEVAWTIVPVLILVAVAIPSFRLLRVQLADPKADIVLKAVGHAWYWSYEYPQTDQGGGFTFDANLDEDAKPRLLAVDNEMVIPVGKVVKLQVTAADVIHSWAMPAFGSKTDAIPGRLNQTWFKAEKEGVFHGQCSELCGQRHAYMPIVVRVVSEQAYADWLKEAKTKYAALDPAQSFAAAR